MNQSPSSYSFTNEWFRSTAKPVWDQIIPQLKPQRILEIGSFEGASTCYLIDTLAGERDIELHCIDTWEGGIENKEAGVDMDSVEARFDANLSIARSRAQKTVTFHKHKNLSTFALASLLTDPLKRGSFDFVYVDGSHQAPDVLADAVLAFGLLRIGGVMAFDDYLWAENLPYGKDPVRSPKIAIDAFTTIYCRKLNILSAPLYQLYVQKTAA
jgi:predicted O-methyltransferase YrrM